ncbi:MAG: carboxypeptidase [Candidatus Marinimicrobia bacterium]|nr:carboxypeptidase [Candidatus Neomarinimicrobiota bacterium]
MFIKRIIITFSTSFMLANSIQDDYRLLVNDIIDYAMNDSIAYKRLQFICDYFGPRLSGSKNLENSITWIIQEMKKDGLSNVEGQRVKVPVWIRGKEKITLLKPFKKNLTMLGLGGSIGTKRGGLTGKVIVVNGFNELEIKSKLVKGNIVLYNVPFSTYGETVKYRYRGAIEAARHGAVASLIRSIGPWSMNTPHTGVMSYDVGINKIPHAALTMEDAMMIGRLYKNKEPIVLKMEMSARTVDDRISRNVISEIKGYKYPDEVVVVGGHIDSWDVGQGAHDDAGGCVASWQVLNIIKNLNLRPKRTIRCVLWTNEENGSRGSKAYRDMYLDKLDKHVVAIESDGGVFSPEGFGFTGSLESKIIIQEISKLLEPISANKITDGGRAADIAPLNDKGVPVMSLKVDGTKYFWYHHTDADTFDKIDINEFNRCVAAMTIMAYVVADLDFILPR